MEYLYKIICISISSCFILLIAMYIRRQDYDLPKKLSLVTIPVIWLVKGKVIVHYKILEQVGSSYSSNLSWAEAFFNSLPPDVQLHLV